MPARPLTGRGVSAWVRTWLGARCGMSDTPLEIDAETAARAFGEGYFNLLRRGAAGSLTLSTDHWRLQEATGDTFRFSAREDDAPLLEVRLEDVERLVWDRLPR